MTRFDGVPRQIQWSTNEFSHRLTVQATPTNVAVIRCAVTPAACAAVAPAPLGHPFWYGVPDLIRSMQKEIGARAKVGV
jgi:hypothetical protein